MTPAVSAVLTGSVERCPDCGLAPEGDAPTLAPGADEVEYDLAGWPPEDRMWLRDGVAAGGARWRWEPGPLLVVGEEHQETVEAVFAEMEAEGPADLESSDAIARDDPGAAADDEVAHRAMSDLFDVADRLLHARWSADLVADLHHLRSVVAESEPPFGLDARTWEDIARLCDAVLDAHDQADEDAVHERARTLRDFLRDYV